MWMLIELSTSRTFGGEPQASAAIAPASARASLWPSLERGSVATLPVSTLLVSTLPVSDPSTPEPDALEPRLRSGRCFLVRADLGARPLVIRAQAPHLRRVTLRALAQRPLQGVEIPGDAGAAQGLERVLHRVRRVRVSQAARRVRVEPALERRHDHGRARPARAERWHQARQVAARRGARSVERRDGDDV